VSLSASSVAAASAAWVWIPEHSTVVECGQFTILRVPDYFDHQLSVYSFQPSGAEPSGAVVDAVLEQVRTFGLLVLQWQVRLEDPPGLAAELAARGAVADVILDVLARDLRGGVPELPPPSAAVSIRWATDAATVRDGAAVGAAGFGGTVPPEDRLKETAAETRRTVEAGEGGLQVAYADRAAVGCGGLQIADGVARLWGGAVLPRSRGQGVYRALLASRLAYAADQGATMALVKGKVDTSGPILRRAGFDAFGQETVFLVPL
jgi:GNAT superfamily N-acetyltransferase